MILAREITFSERSKHIVQVLDVDKAIPILVDHREGLFELLNER